MTTTKENGFTLIEILVALTIAAIIGFISIPNIKFESNQAAIKALISEMDIVADSAQNYASLNAGSLASATLNHMWPDEDNNCKNAIAQMVSSTYLIGISNRSSWYDNNYSTNCGQATFTISIVVSDVYAYQIKKHLGVLLVSIASSSITEDSTVTYSIAKPSLLPIIDNYIALLDGTNTIWNAQDKIIGNVADVSYTFGKKASQAVYNMGLVCDFSTGCGNNIGYNNLNNRIQKPNCASTPTFIITGISSWGASETIGKWTYAVIDNARDWTLDFIIDSSAPSKQTLWGYVTKCE